MRIQDLAEGEQDGKQPGQKQEPDQPRAFALPDEGEQGHPIHQQDAGERPGKGTPTGALQPVQYGDVHA